MLRSTWICERSAQDVVKTHIIVEWQVETRQNLIGHCKYSGTPMLKHLESPEKSPERSYSCQRWILKFIKWFLWDLWTFFIIQNFYWSAWLDIIKAQNTTEMWRYRYTTHILEQWITVARVLIHIFKILSWINKAWCTCYFQYSDRIRCVE